MVAAGWPLVTFVTTDRIKDAIAQPETTCEPSPNRTECELSCKRTIKTALQSD